MNRILFHSVFVTVFALSFVACQKKKDSKSPKAKQIQTQDDKSNSGKPTPEKDEWLSAIHKMTDETSHVYREILVRVLRGQDTDHKPQTMFYVAQQALAQFATGQNIIKNQNIWETEVELKDPKMKVKFFLNKPGQRGDRFFYQLSYGTADDRKELISFELKSEKEVRMLVKTSQFADLVEKGLAISMHSNFHCDYKLENSGDKLMSEVRCEKIPFIQTPERVIVANEFFYTRSNEGAVDLKGDVFTVGTRNQTVELKVAHVGKISVIEKDLYEKAEPVVVAKPVETVPADAVGAGVDSPVDTPVDQSLSGVDDLTQKANPNLKPQSHSARREYDEETGALKNINPDLNKQGKFAKKLNEVRQNAPDAPGTKAEIEGMSDQGLQVEELSPEEKRKRNDDELRKMVQDSGYGPTEQEGDSETKQEEGNDVGSDKSSESTQQDESGETAEQDSSDESAQVPPPTNSDAQEAPQQ